MSLKTYQLVRPSVRVCHPSVIFHPQLLSVRPYPHFTLTRYLRLSCKFYCSLSSYKINETMCSSLSLVCFLLFNFHMLSIVLSINKKYTQQDEGDCYCISVFVCLFTLTMDLYLFTQNPVKLILKYIVLITAIWT